MTNWTSNTDPMFGAACNIRREVRDGASAEADRATAAEPEWAERFSSKIERGNGDCWVWAAGKTAGGYGLFHLNGKDELAHRLAARLSGMTIGADEVIDHTCRNRACVNPEHLRAVDRYTNVHENSEALAHLNAIKTHCPQGHPYADGNLIIRKNGFRRCRECANAYSRQRRAALNGK